eukprot:58503-Chlamydomonas_euryale.AAC.4
MAQNAHMLCAWNASHAAMQAVHAMLLHGHGCSMEEDCMLAVLLIGNYHQVMRVWGMSCLECLVPSFDKTAKHALRCEVRLPRTKNCSPESSSATASSAEAAARVSRSPCAIGALRPLTPAAGLQAPLSTAAETARVPTLPSRGAASWQLAMRSRRSDAPPSAAAGRTKRPRATNMRLGCTQVCAWRECIGEARGVRGGRRG